MIRLKEVRGRMGAWLMLRLKEIYKGVIRYENMMSGDRRWYLCLMQYACVLTLMHVKQTPYIAECVCSLRARKGSRGS